MSWPAPDGDQNPNQPVYGQQPGDAQPGAQQPGNAQPGAQQPPPYGQPPYGPPPYGQPPYGPPAYGPGPYGQPYGQPVYGGYSGPPQPPGQNTTAILSLIFAFVFPPAGVVLGHIAKRQVRDSGAGGDGLATAGLVIGYILSVGLLVLCCGLLATSVLTNVSKTTH